MIDRRCATCETFADCSALETSLSAAPSLEGNAAPLPVQPNAILRGEIRHSVA